MYIPKNPIKIAPSIFSVKPPFKTGENKLLKEIIKKCENNEQILLEKVQNSLNKQRIDNGRYNSIYELEDFDNILLRIENGYVENPQAAIRDSKFITSFEENPNHIIAKLGSVEFIEKVPGINKTKEGFNEALAQMPQKSFNDFIVLIKSNIKKGFYHDYEGYNTLADKATKKINTVDSFTEKSPFYRDTADAISCSLVGKGSEILKEHPQGASIYKKAIKALACRINDSFDDISLHNLFFSVKHKRKRKISKLFKQLNKIKKNINSDDIKEIKKDPNWNALKLKTRKLNHLIDSDEFSKRF